MYRGSCRDVDSRLASLYLTLKFNTITKRVRYFPAVNQIIPENSFSFHIGPLVVRLLRCLETSDTNHTVAWRHIPRKRRPLRKPTNSHQTLLINSVCLIKILESE